MFRGNIVKVPALVAKGLYAVDLFNYSLFKKHGFNIIWELMQYTNLNKLTCTNILEALLKKQEWEELSACTTNVGNFKILMVCQNRVFKNL